MIRYQYPFFIILFTLILLSCDSKENSSKMKMTDKTQVHSEGTLHSESKDEDGHNHDEDHDHDHDDHDDESEEIHLTQKQIEAVGLEFGDFQDLKVNDFISATGTLGIPPNGLNSISPKIAGILVSNEKFVEGDYIRKGAFIGHIENPDLITKQQEFLQVKAELEFSRAELKRHQTLFAADAGIEQQVQKLQARVQSQEVLFASLKKHLEYLGINTNTLDHSNLTDRIRINSTSNGYISKIIMHNGMYALPENPLLQIIDIRHLHLELDVFEKDISKIKVGQKISYTIPALGNEIYQGDVDVIGRAFNLQNKTVRVHGHLDNQQPEFIKDLFINAKIWLNDSAIKALPSDAIIREGENTYIYAGIPSKDEEIQFTKILVRTGSTQNNFTSVTLIDEIPAEMKIVTNGAYYIYAQSQAGKLAHEH